MKRIPGEEKLELAISYILIAGGLLSVAIEAVGIAAYYFSNRNLNIVFQPNLAMRGADFFGYTSSVIQGILLGTWTPMQVLALGIVLLMITPYLRVLASVTYFGFAKNRKYLFMTLFVLVVLTASLLAH